jgi:hypothetical protein
MPSGTENDRTHTIELRSLETASTAIYSSPRRGRYKLAPGVSPGKAFKEEVSPGGAAQVLFLPSLAMGNRREYRLDIR